VAVYLFTRDPQRIYFLAGWWHVGPLNAALPAKLSGWLPSFTHVYAFSLVTATFLTPARRAMPTACVSWWAIDSMFELGQHPALAPMIAAALPGWFAEVPLLDHAASYFLDGTFDVCDMLAVTAGALVAALTLRVTLVMEEQSCTTTL
jgi:hypothetical protein